MIPVAFGLRSGAWRTSILAVGLAWLIGSWTQAVAQVAPSIEKNKAATKTAGPGDAASSGKAKRDATPGVNRRQRGRVRTTFQPDPNAKWACDKTEVVLAPVWRGSKSLTFSFDIRNEGTADLHIRAKGG